MVPFTLTTTTHMPSELNGTTSGSSSSSSTKGGGELNAIQLHLTLNGALKHTAVVEPDRGITYIDGSMTTFQSYAELLASGRRALGALNAIDGLTTGQTLVLQIVERQVHFAFFWGCLLGGIIPVTIAIPPRHEASNAVVLKLLSTITQLDARNVLASTANVAMLRALVPASVCVLDAHALECSRADERGDVIAEAAITAEHVAFYQLTSGSTGTPKVIPERHGAVISHIRHSAVHCGYTRSDVTLNWLPFDHVVPMLTCHLADIYLGRHAVQVRQLS